METSPLIAEYISPLIGLVLLVWIFGRWIFGRANQPEAKRRREQKRLEAKRRTEEAITVVAENAPELAPLRNAIIVLRDFVACAYAYRPGFAIPSDEFRKVHFSFPFDAFFPRDYEGSGDGPDPEPWPTTIDNLLVPKAHELRSIYKECLDRSAFPCSAPIFSFDPPPPPEYPRIELPPSDIKIDADRIFLTRLRKLFTYQAWKLQEAAKHLQNEFVEQKRKAEEAKDFADTYIANERSAYRNTQNSLMTAFNSCKRNWEQQYDQQLGPISSIYQEYKVHTTKGIERHFELALRTLALPLPSNFPWSTFYDPNERLLQINQRVPFITDIVVNRPDSKRLPSKKDTDNFLRRLVPAVSLHIAQHVALNDLYDDLERGARGSDGGG